MILRILSRQCRRIFRACVKCSIYVYFAWNCGKYVMFVDLLDIELMNTQRFKYFCLWISSTKFSIEYYVSGRRIGLVEIYNIFPLKYAFQENRFLKSTDNYHSFYLWWVFFQTMCLMCRGTSTSWCSCCYCWKISTNVVSIISYFPLRCCSANSRGSTKYCLWWQGLTARVHF